MDCELRIVDCGLRSGTEDHGLMGVGQQEVDCYGV